MTVPVLPGDLDVVRGDLQRVATHVLARRRHALTGHVGLRASPGGCAMPAAGRDAEVLRTDGDLLVVERAGGALAVPMTTLAGLAAIADVDLDAPFPAAGDHAPPVGDPDAPLRVSAEGGRALGAWWSFTTTVLDDIAAWLGRAADPTPVQLWPEHFDAACDVAWGPAEGMRANLGGSAGDAFHPEPYLYVGPWGGERPGDEAWWNAPFGALLGHSALAAARDPHEAATAFMRRSLELLAAG
ncbi:MAG: hypothetical protein AB7V62_06190 [Thermoleophilia bacterium]